MSSDLTPFGLMLDHTYPVADPTREAAARTVRRLAHDENDAAQLLQQLGLDTP